MVQLRRMREKDMHARVNAELHSYIDNMNDRVRQMRPMEEKHADK